MQGSSNPTDEKSAISLRHVPADEIMRKGFGGQGNEFEERATRLYGLPFCNMKMHYPALPEMQGEVIVKRLKELWKKYDREHDEDTI